MMIRDFALNAVELQDGYLKNAFLLEQDYLLKLDADRLLAGFYEIAGKNAKGKRYPGGWEDQDIAGHTMGHYLTALAQSYKATGDKKLLERLTYVVSSLAECQAESGYLSAFREELFDNLEQGKQAWVPWYTMHKILSGIISVYQLTEMPVALDVAIRLGSWVSNRVNRWDEAMKARVLATEYGGMNDCLYELYKESGKIEFMMAAEKFDELPLFQEINNENDILDGKHANTTIPKFLGALNRYITVGDNQEFYLDAARKFFDMVVQNHTYVTGGNSEWEHFGAPKILANERTNCNCETCNTYNMLKLARGLFRVTGEKKYLDFYEGTFWNAIVSSQNPKTGMSMYFQPMATGYFKVFSRPFDNFWCCTGTGMENFTKLNDSIYYTKDNTIYIGMYISSRLKDETLGIDIKMTADLPANPVVKVVADKESEGETRLAFRRPSWSKGGFSVTRKGKNLKTEERGGFVYVSIDKGTTEIEAVFVPEVAIHELPDNPNVVAFTYGHLVLSAGLGKEEMVSSTTGVNVTVPTKEITVKDTLIITKGTVEEWKQNPDRVLVRQGNTLNFKLSGTDEDKNLVFSPHYARFEERYGIYWELVQGEEMIQKMPEKKEKKEKKKSRKTLMIVMLVIVLLLLLATGFFVALEVSEGFRSAVMNRFGSKQTSGEHTQPTEVPTPTMTVSENQGEIVVTIAPTEEPVRIVQGMSPEQLEKEVALANAGDLRGFTALIENRNGRQYLTFTNGLYKVSYKYENTPSIMSSTVLNEVIISNGTKAETFYWDYYFESGEAAKLCPYVGDFCKNGREQLAFSFLEGESDSYDTLHVVAGNTLQEYFVIRPENILGKLITVNGYLDVGQKVLADLTSDGRNYYVSLEDCKMDLAEEIYAVKPNSRLTYEISEEGIVLQSFVEVGEGQFIGRIR
ncbi:MAG: glycoside hydrolase family 127 protein, partial [Lachnospiraceae bacterium]|nr:glycoside hydrolase family 127 protein [Lachnospiraceae bacterium]